MDLADVWSNCLSDISNLIIGIPFWFTHTSLKAARSCSVLLSRICIKSSQVALA